MPAAMLSPLGSICNLVKDTCLFIVLYIPMNLKSTGKLVIALGSIMLKAVLLCVPLIIVNGMFLPALARNNGKKKKGLISNIPAPVFFVAKNNFLFDPGLLV